MLLSSIIIVLFAGVINITRSLDINDTVYYAFPPLYMLDDYDACLSEQDGVYCVFDATLKSKENSSLLETIKRYSENLFTYNHTSIHRGICINKSCKDYVHDVIDNVTSPGYDKRMDILHSCLNDNMWKEYRLQAQISDLHYCHKHGETRELDTGEKIFASIMILIVFINVVSTIFHVIYKYRHGKTGNKYIVAFSLINSWNQLISNRESNDTRLKNLRGFDAIRVIAFVLVLSSHSLNVIFKAYAQNPRIIEELLSGNYFRASSNVVALIQVFFILSGFLLTYISMINKEKQHFSILYFFKAVIFRWIRLTPAFLFTFGLMVTWLPRLGSGPVWSLFTQPEKEYCQEKWLYNMLYIQNFFINGKSCMSHTWFIAVDTQLYILATLVFLIMWRYPKTPNYIFGLLFLYNIVTPFALTFIYKLEPIVNVLTPKTIMNGFANATTYQYFYFPTYNNVCGYLAGMVAAFIHYTCEKSNYQLKESKILAFISNIAVPMCLLTISYAVKFCHRDYIYNVWEVAIYTTFDRNIISILMATFCLGIASQCKIWVRKTFELSFWRVLSKLTYAAYLIHFIVMYTYAASSPMPIRADFYTMILLVIVTMVLSYVLAVPIAVFIEIPFISLEKAFVSRDNLHEQQMFTGMNEIIIKKKSNSVLKA